MFLGNWINVWSMMQSDRGLNFIDDGGNWEVGHVTHLIAKRYHECWDCETINYVKHKLWEAADSACINNAGFWGGCLNGDYQGNISEARKVLCG